VIGSSTIRMESECRSQSFILPVVKEVAWRVEIVTLGVVEARSWLEGFSRLRFGSW